MADNWVVSWLITVIWPHLLHTNVWYYGFLKAVKGRAAKNYKSMKFRD
jgi:hypothetical protein